jgi:SAM-dependent methyltransferase
MKNFAYPDSPRDEMMGLIPVAARRVLDVGCAGGAFGAALKRVRPDIEVHGVEPSVRAAEIARGRLDFVYTGLFPGALCQYPEVPQFDCIVFNDVIEHVVDPIEMLDGAARLLSDGGSLVASIPNIRYASVVWGLVARGRWDYRDEGILDRTHLRFYTRRSLIVLFSENGWDVLSLDGVNVPGSRRVPLLALLLRFLGRDFACPQFAIVARRIRTSAS